VTAYEEFKSRLKLHAEYLGALKEKTLKIAAERRLFPVMNDTKWLELQSAVYDLPFPPSYRIKCVTDDGDPKEWMEDAPRYIGDWSSYWDEGLPPFFDIEWLKVLPRYGKYRGRLVADEILDETEEFIALLLRIGIQFKEKNGRFTIYGYLSLRSQGI
jgi:hypothetical protein